MTITSRDLARTITGLTLAVFVSASLPMNAYAGMIGTQAVLDATADQTRTEQLSKVEAMLSRADVQERLVSLGVNPSDALQRARALSSADLAKLSSKSDELRAGGDGGFFALLGVVFIVLLVLDYLDVIHVFHHRR
jgi:hypothetical protein